MAEDNYVVVFDADKKFCRLFRSDSELVPSGEVLWSGMGLRRGYDAMIRLNKERKPVEVYSVCSSRSASGREIFKLVKGCVANGLKVISIHAEHALARAEIKRLTQERDAREQAAKEYSLAIMQRVGIQSKRIPKWTSADMRYITWLEETGKIKA